MIRRGSGVAAAIVVGVVALVMCTSAGAAVLTSAGSQAAPGMGPAHWYGIGGWGNWGPSPPPPAAPPPSFPDPPENLSNPGNGEIMPTTATYVIFWLPSGNHFSNGTTAASDLDYENTVLRYFRDVGGTQVLNTTTQYSGNNGSPADTSNFVTSVVDTTAFPHAGTLADPVVQSDLNQEVFNNINSSGWPFGLSTMYFIFLPNGVVDCNNALTKCNTNAYCAYHTYGFKDGTDTPANDFIWADIPDNFSPTTTKGGCGDSNVTGNESADTTLSSTEHEHMEAITDPRLNAWQDSTGAENGDKCNREMGVADADKTVANNYLGAGNTDKFRIQREWSNIVNGCAASYTTTGSHVESPAPSGGDVGLSVAEPTIAGNPSDSLDYTVSFHNPSNQDDAYAITATVTLPSGVQSGGSSTVVLSLGDLAPHQTATQSFTAHPTGPLLDGTTLTASASFAFNDSTGAAQPTITRTASTLVVNAQPTLALPGPQSVGFNDPLSFGISASDADAGDSVALGASGLPAGLSFTDNGDGTGTVSGTDTADPGTYTVTFSADDHHHTTPVTGTVTITVTQEESAIAYTGAVTADYHDPATVSATLTDPDGGAPIAGKSVTFTVGVGDTCSATTDASGNATCTIVPTQPAGVVPVAASFSGDTDYLSSTDSKAFTITKEETATAYTGPTAILVGGSGVTLTGRLLEDGNPATPIAGRTLMLSLGAQSCTGTTDAGGNAACTITFTGPLGPEPLAATFAGDTFYLPSSDTGKTAIVFAFPSRGAFVLGDTTAAGAGASTVTWWADGWSLLNVLSGGVAPSAFKGFAGNITLPTTTPAAFCTAPWTTTGGNSPPPTSGVPSYMGVVVAPAVTKSGSTISGSYVHIVVVKVNPGYAPNAGSPGTGTIVAAYC
jgi:hypothetical protein